MLATTYKLIEDYGAPGVGMTLSDVWYNEKGGKIAYVGLQKEGDFIDLLRVDIPSFCRSSYNGLIHDLLMNKGLFTTVRQEVPEGIHDRIRNELALLRDPNSANRPVYTQIFQPEPGVQIAMAAVPEPPHALPKPPEEEEPTQDTETISPVTGEVGTSDEDPSKPPISEDTVVVSWKTDKDYETQKNIIVSSEDLDFLKSVIADKEETAQFKKLARYRLNTLSVKEVV